MVKETLFEVISGTSQRPNKFTIGMGKLIWATREETGLSQRDLAEKIYRRQAALSDMENGKMEPDANTLLLLSYFLKKPINYFYPEPWKPDRELETSSEEEKELCIQVKRLNKDNLERILIQIKALANSQGD